MAPRVGWSLNRQVLMPLIGACLIAAIGLAVVSQWLAARAAAADSRARLSAVSAALVDTSFPINDAVLEILQELSGLEFVVLDSAGSMRGHSQGLSREAAARLIEQGNFRIADRASELAFGQELSLDGHPFRAATLHRAAGPDSLLVLLEPQSKRYAFGQQLAIMPLVTGLATLILVGAVSLAVTQRLVQRIADAQRQIQQIAQGQRQEVKIAGPDDQLTSLTQSVNGMADELRSVWRTIRETERSRLLGQVASGLAHQLRNAITGIHLAVQLHRRDCPLTDHESLKVAEAELARTAAYIQQLLHSAAGKDQPGESGAVEGVMREAQSLLQTIASHRRIALTWQRDSRAEALIVHDRELLRSAVMNLVLNALDAAGPGGHVCVRSQVTRSPATGQVGTNSPHEANPHAANPHEASPHEASHAMIIEVVDTGPGPQAELSPHLFEPFVTSKPEGLGVGLTVVRSAAEAFGGSVSWYRRDDRTVFELSIRSSTAS